MALPLSPQKIVLAAAAETTYGTAVSLTNAHAGFRVNDRKFTTPMTTIQRERQGGLGVDANISGAQKSSACSFKTHVAGKGASGVPYWGLFLQGCGFALATATYTASSDSSAWKSLTMGAFIDGRRYLGRGMMGTGKFQFETGMPGVAEWDFKGGFALDPDDTAILTGMTYEAASPPIWAGVGSLTLGGATTYTKVAKVEIDLGCDVSLREDPNSLGGFLGGWIGNRISRVTLDPEATAFAVKNWWADAAAGTTTSLSLVVGTATNNIVTITAANLQVDGEPKYDVRSGKMIDQVSFLVNADDLAFAFS